MGFLDALIGRSKQAPANLDNLFALPAARITLEASENLGPTGNAGVCFKPMVGQEFHSAETELTALLQLGDDDKQTSGQAVLTNEADEFGYRWIVISAEDFDTLVTRVHMVNSTLEEHGYGSQLLCSVFGFAGVGEKATIKMATIPATTYLVYLYKRGTFYPFVPQGSERRDNEAELRLKAELGTDLRIEPELDRWFPIWKLPVH